MQYYNSNFGQSTQLISEIEEIQTRAKYMIGFGLMLAFATLAIVIKNRG